MNHWGCMYSIAHGHGLPAQVIIPHGITLTELDEFAECARLTIKSKRREIINRTRGDEVAFWQRVSDNLFPVEE